MKDKKWILREGYFENGQEELFVMVRGRGGGEAGGAIRGIRERKMEVRYSFGFRPTAPPPRPSRKFNKPPTKDGDPRLMLEGRGDPLEAPLCAGVGGKGGGGGAEWEQKSGPRDGLVESPSVTHLRMRFVW